MPFTWRTLQNKINILYCVVKAAKFEKENPYLVYRRFNWKQRQYIRYKNSQLCWCFEFLTLRVQLVVANSRGQIYFEQQISTLPLVHPTPNLSHIRFAHISRQDKGLCISWSSLKAYYMKPSMLRIWIAKTQELPLATM